MWTQIGYKCPFCPIQHLCPDHYQIHCGLSRTELSHGCGFITYGLVRIGREAGTTETMSLSLPVEGVQVRLYTYYEARKS